MGRRDAAEARGRRAEGLAAWWRRMSRAAETWMAQRPRCQDCGWRYDLIAVAPVHLPSHLRDASRPGIV